MGVAKLSFAVDEGNTLQTTIKSLEVCVQALGRIKTRFTQMKKFWSHVAAHCKNLAGNEQVALAIDFDDMDEFKEAFVESGKGWAALGLVCIQANEALVTSSAQI